MYRDFLKECDDLYPEMGFHEAYLKFMKIAPMWTGVSKLICSAGESSNAQPLIEASGILMEIASLEEEAMNTLFEITSGFIDCKGC
jgi:hypothetical protein